MAFMYSLAQHCPCPHLCWSIDVTILYVQFGGSLLLCAGGLGRG